MADPALQTFCCYPPGKGTDPSVKVLLEFNSRNYNYVCLVSSAIGILGAAYQVTTLISVDFCPSGLIWCTVGLDTNITISERCQ